MPSTSTAWKYFKCLKLENKIECLICHKKLNRGDSSTKALWNHLSTHPGEYELARNERPNEGSNSVFKFFL